MKITALEIKQHEFEKSFRGYNIEEVDIFLNNIANEWERTSNEAKMLRMQLEIAEKEAAKLREVEMSLIKTLQTAENTSSKITEQAKNEAEAKIESAQLEAQRIVEKAKKEAESYIASAKVEVSESQKELMANEAKLQSEITTLKERKASIISQLKALSAAALEDLQAFGDEQTAELKVTEVIEPAKEAIEEIEKEQEEVKGFASSANTLVLEEEDEKTNEVQDEKEVDLTVIEGIGPKIAELLNQHGIETYRDLATHPAYKIKQILETAGPGYAIRDPKTWSEQAMLADSGKWDELEALKEHLIGGKEPEEADEEGQTEVKATAKTPAVEEPEAEENPESTTEEMLDRVNKVKAALKKAMMEKEQTAPKVKTINDAAAEAKENGGSFFDNI